MKLRTVISLMYSAWWRTVLDANLRHVRTIRMWRGEFPVKLPIRIGDETLFVAYSCLGGNDCLQNLKLEISKAHL